MVTVGPLALPIGAIVPVRSYNVIITFIRCCIGVETKGSSQNLSHVQDENKNETRDVFSIYCVIQLYLM